MPVPVDPAGVPVMRRPRGRAVLSPRSPRCPSAAVYPGRQNDAQGLYRGDYRMIGNFLNVCISRLPAGRSVVFQARAARRARLPIRWHDNLPVLGYVAGRAEVRLARHRLRAIQSLRRSRARHFCEAWSVGDNLPLLALDSCRPASRGAIRHRSGDPAPAERADASRHCRGVLLSIGCLAASRRGPWESGGRDSSGDQGRRRLSGHRAWGSAT
jgi:hypothetical protein